MVQRCTNPKNPYYSQYGGRGITICPEWLHSFTQFYNDMGDRPIGKTLDRIDNNKGYSPDNCRWATHHEQQVNRGIQSNNKTAYRGVAVGWKNRFTAQITIRRNKIYLGSFSDAESAALAYDVAAIQLFGINAPLNLLGAIR